MKAICNNCKTKSDLSQLKNKPWTGWKDGKATKVDNFCCYKCGSNDIVFIKKLYPATQQNLFEDLTPTGAGDLEKTELEKFDFI